MKTYKVIENLEYGLSNYKMTHIQIEPQRRSVMRLTKFGHSVPTKLLSFPYIQLLTVYHSICGRYYYWGSLAGYTQESYENDPIIAWTFLPNTWRYYLCIGKTTLDLVAEDFDQYIDKLVVKWWQTSFEKKPSHPKIGSLRKWEKKSKKNPEFYKEVKWVFNKLGLWYAIKEFFRSGPQGTYNFNFVKISQLKSLMMATHIPSLNSFMGNNF